MKLFIRVLILLMLSIELDANSVEKALETSRLVRAQKYSEIGEEYYNKRYYYNKNHDYRKAFALAYMQKSLDIVEQTLGEYNQTTARGYNAIGEAFIKIEEYQKAIKYLKKSLNITTKLGIDISDNYNKSISYPQPLIIDIDIDIDRYRKESVEDKNPLPIEQQIFVNNSINTVRNHNRIALAYKYMNSYDKAIYHSKKAEKIMDSIANYNSFDKATNYDNIARLYKEQEKFEKAIEYYLKYEKVLDKEDSPVKLYNKLRDLYIELGDYSKALYYTEKAFEAREILNYVPPKKSIYRYRKRSYNIDTRESSYKYTKPNYDYTYKYAKPNSYKKQNYNNIYIPAPNTSPKNTPSQKEFNLIESYKSKGLIFKCSKEFTQSLQYYQSAVNLLKDSDGETTAEIYDTMATIYGKLKRTRKSTQYHLKALKIREKLLGKEHIDTAQSYHSLGVDYTVRQNYSLALDYLYKSLKIYETKQIKRSLKVASVFKDLARVYYDKEDYSKAYEFSIKAISISSKRRLNDFGSLSQREKVAYSKRNRLFMQNLLEVTLMYQNSKTLGDTFNRWINYKRSIYDYENSLEELYRDSGESMRRLIREYKNIRFELSREYKKNIMIRSIVEQTQMKITKLEIKLNKHLTPYVQKEINIKDIQKALKPNELYIDFASVEDNYLYFLVTKNGGVTMEAFTLNRDKIDNNIIQINSIMTQIAEGRIFPDNPIIQKHLSSLYKSTIADMNIPKNITTLIVSPDGLLNILPFEALYNDGKYLIEKYKISYIPSAKELVKLSNKKQKVSRHIDIFASPDFDSTTISSTRKVSTRALNLDRFHKLLFAKKEAKEIERLLESKYSVHQYIEDSANEKNLLAIDSPKILHIATHGFYKANSNIGNPMLKSGIVLSGINHSIKNGDNFGIITALDLAGLKLDDTKLVTLSSCESGVGNIQDSEGVGSISKAFIKAGSSYVIMSLWSVNDQSTFAFMKKFYSKVALGDDYSSYLRDAKIKMIKAKDSIYSHPYYWSVFIGSGR